MNLYSLYSPLWALRTASKSQATENEELVNCFLQRSNFLNASLSFGHVHDAFTIVQSRFFFLLCRIYRESLAKNMVFDLAFRPISSIKNIVIVQIDIKIGKSFAIYIPGHMLKKFL